MAAGRPCGVPPRTFLWPQRERAQAGRTQAPGGKKGKERVEIPLNLMCLCDADLRDIPSLENVISVCFLRLSLKQVLSVHFMQIFDYKV